jgi:hypothetical protein
VLVVLKAADAETTTDVVAEDTTDTATEEKA